MVTPAPKKFYFFLACVELTFVNADKETGITRVNATLKSETPYVGVRLLGRAQQSTQLQLAKNLNDPNLQFLNAVFITLNPLGEMPDEEFHDQDIVNG